MTDRSTSGTRPLADCSVTLGITGGIAAYKTTELVREFRRMSIGVQVVMTEAATQLVSIHALATLSERAVVTHLFNPVLHQAGDGQREGISHIQLSRNADLFIVAPATANILGKTAAGIADDVLSTAILASNVPVLFAPAMNVEMWMNSIVQENVAKLRAAGYQFIGPEAGDLACGEIGAGRMSSPRDILDAALPLLLERAGGLRVLVTAGPTEEPVDDVRVLSNRSSGKMGVSLAEAARNLGHRVTLVAGPLRCSPPVGVDRIDVETAEQMKAAVEEHEAEADILIMTAAVADYRPKAMTPGKLPSGKEETTLELVRNPDILAAVAPGRAARGATTIGFALEVGEGGRERAERKLESKQADMIVLNDATRPDSAFGADTTRTAFVLPGGDFEQMPVLPKADAAKRILQQVEALHHGKRAPGH